MKAIRVLVRLPNGTMGIIWVDSITGLKISDLTGYELVGQDGTELNLDGTEKDKGPEVDPAVTEEDGTGNSGKLDAQPYDYSDGGKAKSVFDSDRVFSNPQESAKTSIDNTWGPNGTLAREITSDVPDSLKDNWGPTGRLAKDITSHAPNTTGATKTLSEEMTDLETKTNLGREVEQNLGPKRPDMPTTDVVGLVDQGVKQTLGKDYGISVVSGVGAHGSVRHRKERQAAIDFDVIGPNGRVTDKRQLDAVTESLAAKGMNIGLPDPNYMGASRMHADIAPIAGQNKAVNPGIEQGIAPLDPAKSGPVWKGTPAQQAAVRSAQQTGVMAPEAYDLASQNAPRDIETRTGQTLEVTANPLSEDKAYSYEDHAIDTSAKASASTMGISSAQKQAAVERGYYTPEERESFIGDYAKSIGIDSKTAVDVAKSEGLNAHTTPEDGYQSKASKPDGTREKSYGSFQANIDGGGIGAQFQAATGLDPKDPLNDLALSAYSLDRAAAKNSWGDWVGATKAANKNGAGLSSNQFGLENSKAATGTDYTSFSGKSFGQTFGPSADVPNADMSTKDQYGSYGLGKAGGIGSGAGLGSFAPDYGVDSSSRNNSGGSRPDSMGENRSSDGGSDNSSTSSDSGGSRPDSRGDNQSSGDSGLGGGYRGDTGSPGGMGGKTEKSDKDKGGYSGDTGSPGGMGGKTDKSTSAADSTSGKGDADSFGGSGSSSGGLGDWGGWI